MKLRATFIMALRALRRNKMRTVLTLLGVVIGAVVSAGDMVAITGIQMMLMLQIRATFGKDPDVAQMWELLPVVGGGFGWRALARELVSFIPLGGGLLPKGAIAYAATYVLGKGLEHFHGVGYGYTRAQRRDAYQVAYERGKEVVSSALGRHAVAK